MKGFTHRYIRNLMQDGEPKTMLENRIVMRHLTNCDECNQFAAVLANVSGQMRHWNEEPALSHEKRQKLISIVSLEGEHKKARMKFIRPIRASVGITFIILFVFGWIYTLEHFLPKPEPVQQDNAPIISFEINDTFTPGRHVLYEGDLDCDGFTESLVVNRMLVPTIGGRLLQVSDVFLVSYRDGTEIVLWNFADYSESVNYFFDPLLFSYPLCTNFIAIPIKWFNEPTRTMVIFRWQNNHMREEFVVNGWPRGLLSQELESFTGRCKVEALRYIWNGDKFVLITKEYKDIRCQLR